MDLLLIIIDDPSKLCIGYGPIDAQVPEGPGADLQFAHDTIGLDPSVQGDAVMLYQDVPDLFQKGCLEPFEIFLCYNIC